MCFHAYFKLGRVKAEEWSPPQGLEKIHVKITEKSDVVKSIMSEKA